MSAVVGETDSKLLRNFGLTMAIMFILVFGLVMPWIRDVVWPRWPWIVAAVFSATGLIYPKMLRPVYIVWMQLAHVLQFVNTRVLLCLVFFVVVTPIGCIFRLLGKDPMARKFDRNAATYRVKSTQPSIENLEKPF